jgi:hypothetical protein
MHFEVRGSLSLDAPLFETGSARGRVPLFLVKISSRWNPSTCSPYTTPTTPGQVGELDHPSTGASHSAPTQGDRRPKPTRGSKIRQV